MFRCRLHRAWLRTTSPFSAALGLLLALAGCGSDGSLDAVARVFSADGAGSEASALRIASAWPRSERRELEREFRDWRSSQGGETAADVVRLLWLDVPAAAPGVVNERAFRADLLLGGPQREYVRLGRAGRLLPLESETRALWLSLPRRSTEPRAELDAEGAGGLPDPRTDPLTLDWATGQQERSDWPEFYARLVRLYGRAVEPSGWRGGSVPALAEEGAAACRGTSREQLARAFLRFLADRRSAKPGLDSRGLDPDTADLLADLLGATLVDAQDELRSAWAALDRRGSTSPSPAQVWMTEPPPWPPASVEKLQSRAGDRALALVHELAGQIAPDPEARFWLVQSWLRSRRPIDGSLLGELAHAGSGRLVREPRFRAWLRAEWTAWARQRYRRIARVSTAPGASLSPDSTAVAR
jgi:hypothetical protein